MRLLHASDLHLGVTHYGTGDSRLRDFEATLRRLADDALAHDVAYVVISGDTFDTRRPGPDWLRVFASFVHRVGRLIIVPGNHDGMTTIGDPSTHALLWLKSLGLPGVHVLTEPGVSFVVDRDHEGVHIFALPYPHKRGLDAQLADMPVDARATEVGRQVEEAIRALAVRPSPDVPFVFVGHVGTIAAKLGSEAAMKMGWDALIDPGVLAPFDYAALGHIHRLQQVRDNAWYAGSPEYLDFGDAESEKGWLLVDVEPGQKPVVTPRPSGARPMADYKAGQAPDGTLVFEGVSTTELARGAIVRLVITATVARPKASEIADAIRWFRDAGASFVKADVRLDLPTTATTSTTEPDAEATDLDLLERWLTDHGHPTEPTMSVGRRLLADIDTAA